MQIEPILDQLCRRHGIDSAFAWRLAPLIERAHAAPSGVRERLLRLVEKSAEREGQRCKQRELEAIERNERALLSVARMLHAWTPPPWVG